MAKTNKTKQVFLDDSYHENMLSEKMDEVLDATSPKCPISGCTGEPIITDTSSGEIICGSCGRVLLEKSIDPNPEHISDASEFVSKTRTGPEQSLTMYDMGMMTVISNKDAMGNSLSQLYEKHFWQIEDT